MAPDLEDRAVGGHGESLRLETTELAAEATQ
jgi:hypothetical protein